METRVLIIEDDKNLAEALRQILKQNSYSADVASDGTEGLRKALSDTYDAIVLDIMLPGLDGFDVLDRIRKTDRNTPIIMLTARDRVRDKVSALDKGADDYLTKPFETDELLARLRVMIRRNAEPEKKNLCLYDLILNIDNHILRKADTESGSSGKAGTQKHIRLGYKEFEILKMLMSNPNMIISKEMLISRIWGDDSDAVDNNVEVYISFLRKKFDFIDSRTRISVIRKVGYKLDKEDV